jgi:hypothetical protein
MNVAATEGSDVENALGSTILAIRNRRVILDADLARAYGVTTKALNQAVKRNKARFPEDFAFRLTADEVSQTDKSRRAQAHDQTQKAVNRSQIVTGSAKHRDPRFAPIAFTERGVLMAANVLGSIRAIQMSIYVVRAFVRLRETAASNAMVLRRLAEIDSALLQHDAALRDIYRKLLPLVQPPPDSPKRRIGFHTDTG